MINPELIVSADASQTHKTDKLDVSRFTHGSMHLIWSGLTGTINGSLKIQVSNVTNPQADSDWVDKTGATIALSGASGGDLISLNDSMSEKWVRGVYSPGGITGGTVSLYANVKGGSLE